MSPDILTAGSWVVVRGVARWMPAPVLELVPTNDWVELIACPTCHAKTTERCRQSGGRAREPHPDRLTARRCPCGDLPNAGATYCEPCRVEARRESWRSYSERRRQKRNERDAA